MISESRNKAEENRIKENQSGVVTTETLNDLLVGWEDHFYLQNVCVRMLPMIEYQCPGFLKKAGR